MARSERDSNNSYAPVSGFDPELEQSSTPEIVVSVALTQFAEHGFAEAKLEKIAKISGMSKRMIHYYFGDKKGLYIKTISHALELLRPDAEAMQLDSAVPVDGVRKIVEAVYRCITMHPNPVRLLLMENICSFGGVEGAAALSDESNILLNLDKLLMLGQDAGAFRPGISAEDVLVLISSLGYFRLSNQTTMDQLYHLDMSSEANTEGMRRLVVDTVLAFLTSNLQHTGPASYLSVGGVKDEPEQNEDLYDFDTNLFDE